MIIRKTSAAGRAIAIFMVIALIFAANCCVLDASAATLGTTIYLKTTKTTTPYIHYWDNGQNGSAWPGVAMQAEGDNVYSYDLPCDIGTLAGVIFLKDGGGDGSKLTDDVTNITGNLYDLDASKWDMYDTSAVRITSFEIDNTSLYVGSKATLTASAEGEGAVSYKFSANGTVISDYSAKSTVAFAPTEAGDYTLTLDVKDASGNENSRKITCTVKSIDGAEEPIFLSAAPANGSKIKKDSSVTVKVEGAGGQVNNKILFYKTEILDPNGNPVNTPYYQKGNQVTFQPSVVGEYTVNMYIQNNTVKNTTTMATYTYVSTTEDITDTDEHGISSDVDTQSDVPVISDVDTESDEPVVSDIDTTDSDEPIESDTDTTPDTSDTDVEDNLIGDFDDNGETELSDAYSIQKSVLAKTEFTADQLKRGDVNGDGKITLKDASLVQLYRVGLAVVTSDGKLAPKGA